MKKKLVAIFLCVALVAVGIVGASLAYFTDTDDATNTFTAGGVKIELIEQERKYDEDGKLTGLGAFTQNKMLMPSHNDAQGAKDKYGMSVVDNYVDKIVTVKNTGKSDAYVRVIVAVPAALEEDDPTKAAANVLHWNLGNKFTAKGDYDTTANPQPDNPAWADVSWKYTETVTIGGVSYNLYIITYKNPLAPNATTDAASFVGFYLDKDVDCEYDEDGKLYYTITKNGETRRIAFDLTNGVTIPVYAQAVQAAGFDTADDAFTAANMPGNPWAPAT